MAGKPPRRDEYGIAPEREACSPRVSRQPDPRRARDPPPLRRADRNRRSLDVRARLDLDKGDRTASLGDEIDFAARHDKPAIENLVALEAQQHRGDLLRLEPEQMSAAPTLGPLNPAFASHRRR